MEEFMAKGPVGESIVSEVEGLRGVVSGQREEIEKRDRVMEEQRV